MILIKLNANINMQLNWLAHQKNVNTQRDLLAMILPANVEIITNIAN